MFRTTDRQVTLMGRGSHLGAEARRRLEGTWAAKFEQKVLPILLQQESRFSGLYSNDNGRPNFPVAVLLGLSILQEWQNLSDQAAVDALLFDSRWQLALGIDPSRAYLTRRTLVSFRGRLVERDPDLSDMKEVFLAISSAAIESLGNEIAVQRLDSTHIASNIRTRGRVDLFGKTLLHFLRWLEDHDRPLLARLPVAMTAWFERAEGLDAWEPSLDEPGRRRRLQELADWLGTVVTAFSGDEVVRAAEPYQLVARLFAEHCQWADTSEGEGDGPPPAPEGGDPEKRVQVRKKPKAPGSSLQSPFDPDAGYSPKGVGYLVQIAETCGNKQAAEDLRRPEIITDYEVHAAAERDFEKAIVTIERLKAADLAPEVLLVDGQYVTGASLIAASAMEVDLHGPSSLGRLPVGHIGRDQFEFDEHGHVVACPEGHAPVTHTIRTTDDERPSTLHAKFDAKTCTACPRLGTCAVRPPNGKKGNFHLDIEPDLRARDANLKRMTDPEWQQRYRLRSGIEATNSELKRAHGLGHLRVRRMQRVRLAVAVKLTACNVKRWTRYLAARQG